MSDVDSNLSGDRSLVTKHKRRRRIGSCAGLLAGSVVLAGCSVGPDFIAPKPATPAAWSSQTGRVAPSGAASLLSAEPTPVAWWDSFGDPELSALERRVAAQNLDVRTATARLAESRAQLRITNADAYPMLSAGAGYTRQQVSSKLIQRGLTDYAPDAIGATSLGGLKGEAGSIQVPPVDLFRDSVDASWELDLWGRVRRGSEAARATLEASEDNRRGALVSALGEVARDYMTLRGLQAQLALQQTNLQTAQGSLNIAQQRYHGGLASELDPANAQAQVQITAARIPQLQAQIDGQVNALSLLLGEAPQALASELDTPHPVPALPPVVPVGLPSALAARRPDVRAAERQLHAATAQIGVAVANFYPQVTLSGSVGTMALSLRDLPFWSAAAYNFGPQISIPLFQGGKLRGQLDLRKAQQVEAAISYQKTVLSAFHDVSNAMTSYQAEQVRRDSIAASVDAAQTAMRLANEQYRGGLVTFLDVLNAERTLLDNQQQLADSDTTLRNDLVAVYNALGGGWQTSFPEARPVRTAQR